MPAVVDGGMKHDLRLCTFSHLQLRGEVHRIHNLGINSDSHHYRPKDEQILLHSVLFHFGYKYTIYC